MILNNPLHRTDTPLSSTQGTTVRNTNLELFRIITMYLIIAHHYVVNSGLYTAEYILADPTAAPSIFLLIFGAWGKVGINCFVLITGYFMCKSSISAKKFAKLLFEVIFYSIVINLIFWLSGYGTFTVEALIHIIFPISEIGTDFTHAFLIFFLCIPFLNILIHNMTQKQHVYLMLLMSFTYVLTGTLRMFFTLHMNYVSWFSILFLFASYVRLYPNKIFNNVKFWAWMTVVSLLLSVTSILAGAWFCKRFGVNISYYFIMDSNTLLAVLTGFSAFMLFKNMNVPYCRLINTIAASSFGVLLIHANSDTMRRWLWGDVLNNMGVFHEAWMPVHAIFSVLAIQIICTAIDYLRIQFIEKPVFQLWDKYYEYFVLKYKKLESSVCNKLSIQEQE